MSVVANLPITGVEGHYRDLRHGLCMGEVDGDVKKGAVRDVGNGCVILTYERGWPARVPSTCVRARHTGVPFPSTRPLRQSCPAVLLITTSGASGASRDGDDVASSRDGTHNTRSTQGL